MIDKDTFEAVCNNAKLKLEYGGDDYAAICGFLDDIIADIDKIELDTSIELTNLDLVNTFREDIPRPPLPRSELLAAIGHAEAGCVSIPVKLREEG